MNYQDFIRRSPLFLFILFLLLLLSCTKTSNELTLIFPNKVNYESFIIANHLGYFAKADVGIKVITVNSGINAAETIALGEADVAAMGDGPAVILMSQRKNISIISRYAKGNKIHRLIADTLINQPKQLIGKRIGMQMGSSTHAAFLAWLQNNGILIKQVEIVPMDPKNMPEAMATKQLDAIAGSEPWTLNVEKLCNTAVYELANLQSAKNHFPHLLIATNSCLKTKKEALVSIISALDRANKFIKEMPDSAAIISSQYIGFTSEDAAICMSRLSWERGWSESDSLSIETTIDFFVKSGRISQKTKLGLFINIIEN